MTAMEDIALYLRPAYSIDSDHPEVMAYARAVAAGTADPAEAMRRLYLGVRDDIRYDPYVMRYALDAFIASRCLVDRAGVCVSKAALMCAGARALGVPSRIAFADVRNHLATRKFIQRLGTDEFIYHGYAELWLHGRWVKVTPIFNRDLCEKFGTPPLEFDGVHDAIFHPFNGEGRPFMEYLRDRGNFADVPTQLLLEAYRDKYGRSIAADGSLCARKGWVPLRTQREGAGQGGDYAREAEAERDAAKGP